MVKSSELLVIVDSVEEAVKFYTEKLAFDLVDAQEHPEYAGQLLWARLRKGKCAVIFKMPQVEEFAEFSFIKRCSSRCAGLYLEMKKGVERYLQRCQRKGVKIVSELRTVDGHKQFALRDNFGIKLVVVEVPEKKPRPSLNFIGLKLQERDILHKERSEAEVVNDMVAHLRTFGVLRRAAKKFAKARLKQLAKKK